MLGINLDGLTPGSGLLGWVLEVSLIVISKGKVTTRIHGLPAVAVPAFFPSVYKNDECWWGTRNPKTVYACDWWHPCKSQ